MVVVGGDAFRSRLDDVAARAGAVVVAQVPTGNGHLSAAVREALGRCDEFVVEADAFEQFTGVGEDVIGSGHIIRVAATDGRVEHTANGHPLPADPFAPLAPAWQLATKRVIDVVLALVGLVLTFPVLLLAAAAIKLDSPGPVMFRQVRLGAGGRPFAVWKLRTMFVNNSDDEHRRYVAALMAGSAPKHNGMYKLANDRRVTRVGRLVRRYSIDELPQLLNVVRGDMSLVGPRPPLPTEARRYDARTWCRLRGRPGVTGLWQINGRSEVPFDVMVDLDVEYWQRWSIWLDLRILARTPFVVLSARGAS